MVRTTTLEDISQNEYSRACQLLDEVHGRTHIVSRRSLSLSSKREIIRRYLGPSLWGKGRRRLSLEECPEEQIHAVFEGLYQRSLRVQRLYGERSSPQPELTVRLYELEFSYLVPASTQRHPFFRFGEDPLQDARDPLDPRRKDPAEYPDYSYDPGETF